MSGIPGAPRTRRAVELAMDRVLDHRYRIVESLGSGGSAQVYLAEDEALGRQVALKVLDPDAARDQQLRHRFVKEARALAQLSHPNIVAVYDVGEVDGLPFIVMERLSGGSLKERIERAGPLEVADAFRITTNIAAGLDAAHARGIVHADLKPSNILFDDQGRAKIADFGIARTPQDSAETPQLFATAMYVAPERVQGRPPTARSDVYGLGLILYEMLAGRPPFTSANAQVLLRDHLVRAPEPPSRLRPSLPRELDEVVTKALAKDPGLRYARAGDLVSAFARLQGVEDPLASVRLREDVTAIMPAPLEGLLPYRSESPAVAFLARHARPLRRAFYTGLLTAPLWALLSLAGVDAPYAALLVGLPAIIGLAGHIAAALALTWILEGLALVLFAPVLAAAFLLSGLWLALREYSAEQAILALAAPVLAPLGLAPAAILVAPSLHGLAGVLTVAWGAVLAIIVGVAQGLPTSSAFVVTGLPFKQVDLLQTSTAVSSRQAFLDIFRPGALTPQERLAPLAQLFDPKTLWDQLIGFVSRLAGAELTATIGTIAAWVLAAAMVWVVTRLFRMIVDTLFRPQRWFVLYVLASVLGVFSGALLLYAMFATWTPLAHGPDRVADAVLFVSALVGAVLATAATAVIGATHPLEPVSEDLNRAAGEVRV